MCISRIYLPGFSSAQSRLFNGTHHSKASKWHQVVILGMWTNIKIWEKLSTVCAPFQTFEIAERTAKEWCVTCEKIWMYPCTNCICISLCKCIYTTECHPKNRVMQILFLHLSPFLLDCNFLQIATIYQK